MTTTTHWTGHADDYLWSDAANWTAGAPAADVNATLGGAGNYYISLAVKKGAAVDAVGALWVGGGSWALGAGELDFSPGAVKGSLYDLVLNKGASLTVLANAKLVGVETMYLGHDGSATTMTVYGRVSQNYALVEAGSLVVTYGGHWVCSESGFNVGGQGKGKLIVSHGGIIDEGAAGLTLPAAQLTLGDGLGDGTAVVTGAGSSLTLTEVYVGEGYAGHLSILDGGQVIDGVGVIAPFGDGYVTVAGKGSRWVNRNGLAFGPAVPTDSWLKITNFGEVDWGSDGFYLVDNLKLDGSAKLGGQSIFDGGQIDALAGHGDVTVHQNIEIITNWLFQFKKLASFSGVSGGNLKLTGKITGDSASILYAASGNVAVEHAYNNYGSTEIYSASLEVGANGALGTGVVDFVGGTHAATLLIDSGVKLGNAISGFGAADTIDLAGLNYVSGVTDVWHANSGGGGTLTITSGAATATLHFADTFSAAQFAFSADAGDGTLLKV